MPLPAPDLDDRRFQDLVDDAKRLVQRHCPEWTDHNVSDPGVTLIETFAYITDQLLYRLNQVPELDYVKFLDLIGVRMFPPAAARAHVTFWLSAAQPEVVTIPEETQVSTLRGTDEPVVFTTIDRLRIVPCARELLATDFDGTVVDRDAELSQTDEIAVFDDPPKPGDALLIGLSAPVPSCAVGLHFEGRIEGHGVDPLDPPLRWEAFDGERWHPCEVDRDETGGLNRPGEIVIHVPPEHRAGVINRRRAGWIRCRVQEPSRDQPFYTSPPRVRALDAYTVGGTVETAHAERTENETIGLSEGVAGQRFRLRRAPVIPIGELLVVEVASGAGWDRWVPVDNFADSGPDHRHFILDAVHAEIVFGPAVRLEDGAFRQYGAVPPKGAPIRVVRYWTGGGRRGNVSRGALCAPRTAIQYVARVENRRAAEGGVDGESLDNAKARGPIVLRTKNRAVTTEDYEYLARTAAPEIARVRCVPADAAHAGGVRVLLVPAAADDDEHHRLRYGQLVPSDATLRRIADDLDARRCVGARVVVEPPLYQGITVVAQVRARPDAAETRLHDDALAALYGYFHPLRGGPDGDGWPFGRPVLVGEVYSVLQQVKGLAYVEEALLFGADPVTGERGDRIDRIDIEPNALVFSFDHQLRVIS